jgi:PIN domain nuclease of toxin-antitoxin system
MGATEVILLDTHVLLWLSREPERLSRRATQAIRRARTSGGLALSCISLFEIAQLAARGRITLKSRLDAVLAEIEGQCVIQPLTRQLAAAATQLPQDFPADPMDRIIGATAMVGGLKLVTADERIRAAKVIETVW